MRIWLACVFAFLGPIASPASGAELGAPAAVLGFAQGSVQAELAWIEGPRSPEKSSLRLDWKRSSDGQPIVPPGSFKVSLWMPGMGHGSSPTKVQPILDEGGAPLVGAYLVSNVYFTMGGKWDVNLTLRGSDGSEETKTLKVEIQGGHHH